MATATKKSPMFTQRHYEWIAAKLRATIEEVDEAEENGRSMVAEEVLQDLIYSISSGLKADNPNFKTERFFEACGGKP